MRNFLSIIISVILLFTSYTSFAADGTNYGLMIQEQSDQIKELKSRIEVLENMIDSLLQSQSQSSASKNTTVSSVLSTQKVQVGGPGLDQKEEEAVRSPKSQYDLALAALKAGKLNEAEERFVRFIEEYPGHKLQENAIFWYAESFYRRGDFNKAAINYSKAYKQYKSGAKAPDSLLKLAFSLGDLDRKKEACNILDKLDKEFPNRSNNSMIRTKHARSKFNCK